MKPPIVFMGSPEFAVPILRRLVEQYPVRGVVTQPDRPSGRGRVVTPPPIKRLAEELELPVIQPRKLREPESMQQLSDWCPDLIIVAAFGQILKPDVLGLPKFGCINVHASLLPRWRGAAPIQAAVLNGDMQTGITIMQMDAGVDTGAILSQAACPISSTDTSQSLSARLSELGADVLIDTLHHYISGDLPPQVQDDSLATYAPIIKKEDGLLDFAQPAILIERKVRAYYPWPGVYTYWKNQVLKLHQVHVLAGKNDHPGEKVIIQDLPAITTGDGILVIDQLQLAGRNIQNGKVFLQGAHDWIDTNVK